MTQPAVSRQLAALEREVGVALVARGPRHVSLTPAGAALAEEAEALLPAIEAAGRRLRGFAPPTAGRSGSARSRARWPRSCRTRCAPCAPSARAWRSRRMRAGRPTSPGSPPGATWTWRSSRRRGRRAAARAVRGPAPDRARAGGPHRPGAVRSGGRAVDRRARARRPRRRAGRLRRRRLRPAGGRERRLARRRTADRRGLGVALAPRSTAAALAGVATRELAGAPERELVLIRAPRARATPVERDLERLLRATSSRLGASRRSARA